MQISGGMDCIYTGSKLLPEKSAYDLDHFIPWSFVSHDLLWNLLPINPNINSSKSDNLPPLEIFIKPFALEHQKALKTLYPKTPSNKIFEDYLTLYHSVSAGKTPTSRKKNLQKSSFNFPIYGGSAS